MSTSLLQLLAPTRCVACGARSSPPWCEACRGQAESAPDGCRRCGDPWDGHACPATGLAWRRTVSVWRHRGPARDVVAVAKARGAWAGWERLGREVADRVVAAWSWEPDVVTWVPGRTEVVRRRGIDHARTLAEPVALALDRPLVPLVSATTAAGRRVGGAGPARGAPFVPRGDAVRHDPRRVLLVDDVLTTGATVRTVLDALPESVEEVRVATWTRAGADQSGASDD